MNGIRYGRLKQRLTCAQLGRMAGCAGGTVSRLEKEIKANTSYLLLLRLADALEMTLDELVMEYPEEAIGLGDHPISKHPSELPLNPVGKFCRIHNISLPQLAHLLGKKSRQSVWYTCIKPKLKPNEILPLAQLEGLTVEEFLIRYHTKEENAA